MIIQLQTCMTWNKSFECDNVLESTFFMTTDIFTMVEMGQKYLPAVSKPESA